MTDSEVKEADDLILARHGTVAFPLPPTAIIGAAYRDFRRREENQALAKEGGLAAGDFERYAFAARHVKRANGDAAKLIQLALDEWEIGLDSKMPMRIKLYGQRPELRKALDYLERAA